MGVSAAYPLSATWIDALAGRCPGAYALGTLAGDGVTFIIRCVGRADDDLNSGLHGRVGRYSRFRCVHCGTVRESSDKQCSVYRSLDGATNLRSAEHPQRPPGVAGPCPVTDCTELR
jgi:hypothetical protein